MSERFALYFSPSLNSALGIFGDKILQRTPHQGRLQSASSSFHDQGRWRKLTEKAAHYGFHATLKAPFELKPGRTESEVFDIAKSLCAAHQPINLTTLKPRKIEDFVALTLEEELPYLSALALVCEKAFEPLRMPLSADDKQRRLKKALTPRQVHYLDLYGYPYVNEEFKYHMTLSTALAPEDQDFVDWVSQCYAKTVIDTPCLDQLSIFYQPNQATPFVEIATHTLDSR